MQEREYPYAQAAFERLLSANDAAQLIGIHSVTLLRWSREGIAPHVRLGRRVLFRASELNTWINMNFNLGSQNAA